MKNAMKKLLSLTLALIMVVGVFPMAAFAAENEPDAQLFLDEEALEDLVDMAGDLTSEYAAALLRALKNGKFYSWDEIDEFIREWVEEHCSNNSGKPGKPDEDDKVVDVVGPGRDPNAGNSDDYVEVIKPSKPSNPNPEDKEEEEEGYVIHLNPYGTGYTDTVEVTNGKIPALPKLENTASKAFLYWFESETGEKLVAGEEFTFERDIYAMALWQDIPMSDGEKEDATYTLTLDENTGNVSKVKQITVEYGKRIGDVLYEPEREGYEFAGWFLNKKEIDHNFKWNIEGDATAYAKWVKKGSNDRPGHDDDKDDYHNVYVDLNYDNKMGETVKRVIDGAKMSRVLKYVEEPTRKGYSFAGWYWDAKCKDDVDGDEKVTRDCTIYAKWTRRNSDKEVLLKIYLNENTKAAAKVVDMDAYDNDGKITLTEVEKVVRKYYEEKYDDDDMDIDGLFTAKTWNHGDYSMRNAKKSIEVNEHDDTVIYVMVRDAQKISSGTADTSNPKTGDNIMMVVSVMIMSGAALAYVFSKKRAAR